MPQTFEVPVEDSTATYSINNNGELKPEKLVINGDFTQVVNEELVNDLLDQAHRNLALDFRAE